MRKRTIKISVRLTEQEHSHLKQQAATAGYAMEPFIRALVAGVELKPHPPDTYRELLREMSAIGNNINQIAKAANIRGYARNEDVENALELQKQLWQKVKAL